MRVRNGLASFRKSANLIKSPDESGPSELRMEKPQALTRATWLPILAVAH